MPKWLIQPVKIEEQKISELISLLDKGSIGYDIVYPYKGQILNPDKSEYQFNDNEQYFVCGSYPLTRYVYAKCPSAVFSLEDYRVEQLMDIFGKNNFVNSDAKIIHTKDIIWNEEYFIRPIDDTKSFNGGIHTPYTLNYEGYVILAPLKHIEKEYRFFIIDGEIITASQYKLNGELYSSSLIDSGAENFAKEMINYFNHPGYVIDIAQIGDRYKIMELNCLNASGLYDINLYKLVMAVEDYYDSLDKIPRNKP